MRLVFKVCLIIYSLLAWSCSSGNVTNKQGLIIGEEIPNVASDDNSNSDDGTLFFAFDPYSRRLNFINADSLDLRFSEVLDSITSQSGERWITGLDGRYYFGVANDMLYFYNNLGERQLLNAFAASVVSYAANRDDGQFVFVDELDSIMLVSVDPSGKLLDSWVGGSVLSNDGRVEVGDILKSGRFVITSSEDKLISIDIAASIAARSWVMAEYDGLVSSVVWLGKSEDNSDHALIYTDSDKLMIFDAGSGSILQEFDLSGLIVTRRKSGTDHIITFNNSTNETRLYFGGEQGLETYLLPNVTFTVSDTKVQSGYLLAVGGASSRSYYKVRLSDGLVEQRVDSGSSSPTGFTTDYVVTFEDSPLGYIKLINFDDRKETIFSGFNLEFLQK